MDNNIKLLASNFHDYNSYNRFQFIINDSGKFTKYDVDLDKQTTVWSGEAKHTKREKGSLSISKRKINLSILFVTNIQNLEHSVSHSINKFYF